MQVSLLLAIADAACMAAFYLFTVKAAAPLVIAGDSGSLHLLRFALILLLVRLLLRLGQAWLTSSLSERMENLLRSELMAKLLVLSPSSPARRPAVSTLMLEGVDEVLPYFTHYLQAVRTAAAVPLVMLGVIAAASWTAALALLLLAPLIPLFLMMTGRAAQKLNERQWAQIVRLSGRFQEALRQVVLLKLFNLEQRELAKIARTTRRWRIETMQVLKVAFLSALVLEFFSTVGVAFCAIYLGFAVYEDGFSYERALFVLLCAPEFFLPLRNLGQNYHARLKALGAAAAMLELLEAEEQPQVMQGRIVLQEGDGPFGFVFSAAAISYPSGLHPVLADLNCTIKAGRVTALIGPSGCGKTTLLLSLCGLLPLEAGELTVNNHAMAELDATSWRRLVAYIPQTPHLLYGTLRSNLQLAAPEAGDDELKAALHAVGADFLLQRFAQGLDQKIGDNGSGISGGELRLIALARAVLRDCPVILLDEPTASLDRITEENFLNALRKIAVGRTVVMTAHRPELIRFADEVVDLRPFAPLLEQQEESCT